MPDLSPELLDVVAMLRENASYLVVVSATLFDCDQAMNCRRRADELERQARYIELGRHVGAHARAQKEER